MAYCSGSFAINVIGGTYPCDLTIDSDDRIHNIAVADAADGDTVTVELMYKIGSPKRSVFASSYTSARTGGDSGSPPALGNRNFNKVPDTTLAADEVDSATFTAQIPAYAGAETTNLAGGTDNYSVILYLREATERIGGDTPPANLDPANPA